MKLTRLLGAVSDSRSHHGPDPDISAITPDSRQIGPGALFVAIPGTRVDGHDFVSAAIAGGAAAIVSQRPLSLPSNVCGLVVEDSRLALAQLARRFYGEPDRAMGLIGVTGTDGKTTTCSLISHLLTMAGSPCGIISTAQIGVGAELAARSEHQTTPSAVRVCALLAEMVDAGNAWAVIEATSHGLDQKRVDGLQFDIAAYTQITHEHLEYHRTPERYRAAKARLADLVESAAGPERSGALVLNAHDPFTPSLAAGRSARVVTYGRGIGNVVSHDESPSGSGTRFQLDSPWGSGTVSIPLKGAFNVENALAAIAVGALAGFDLEDLLAAAGTFAGAPGRMQFLELGQEFALVVDYAHTPASLQAVLTVLRQRTAGKLIAVFGSAGERDRGKRPMMGRIAAGLADLVVITDEDPRGENRDQIAAEIAAGIRSGNRNARFEIIHDRWLAVAYAASRAGPGDLVALLGKGHEQSIIGASGPQAYDEADAARKALAALG